MRGRPLAPSSSACGWWPRRARLHVPFSCPVSSRLSCLAESHVDLRERPGGHLPAQRRLRPPQGAARREPGDGGAGSAVGRRGQREGGGSAGAGRRHRVPLPGEGSRALSGTCHLERRPSGWEPRGTPALESGVTLEEPGRRAMFEPHSGVRALGWRGRVEGASARGLLGTPARPGQAHPPARSRKGPFPPYFPDIETQRCIAFRLGHAEPRLHRSTLLRSESAAGQRDCLGVGVGAPPMLLFVFLTPSFIDDYEGEICFYYSSVLKESLVKLKSECEASR